MFGPCLGTSAGEPYCARMAAIEDHAICVRTWDWSETSQTAVLITKNHGMIRVLAKGSKRDRSAFSGGLELCTHGHMGAILRPSSDLALMTHWDLLDPMRGVRQGLLPYNTAMLGVDLIPRLIQDHDPHPEVYEALYGLLERCCEFNSTKQADQSRLVLGALAWYQWTVLVAIGAMPVVDHDVLTGEQLTTAEVYGFSAQLGGVTQDPINQASVEHAADDARSAFNERSTKLVTPEGLWRVRAQTIELMRQLGESPSIDLFWGCSVDQLQRIARLLGAYIQDRSGTDISAMDWLFAFDHS